MSIIKVLTLIKQLNSLSKFQNVIFMQKHDLFRTFNIMFTLFTEIIFAIMHVYVSIVYYAQRKCYLPGNNFLT